MNYGKIIIEDKRGDQHHTLVYSQNEYGEYIVSATVFYDGKLVRETSPRIAHASGVVNALVSVLFANDPCYTVRFSENGVNWYFKPLGGTEADENIPT